MGHDRCERIRQVGGGGANNIPAIKCAMDLLGLTGGTVRPPITNLNPADQADAHRILSDWGLLG